MQDNVTAHSTKNSVDALDDVLTSESKVEECGLRDYLI
jgi:hypothetical protein